MEFISYGKTVVDDNVFTANNRGLWIGSINSSASITNSTFNVGNNGNQYNFSTYPYGACLQNCPTYDAGNNYFDTGLIGLAMLNKLKKMKIQILFHRSGVNE